MRAKVARKIRKMLNYKVGAAKVPFEQLYFGTTRELVASNKAANAYRQLKKKYLALNKP